MIHIKYDLKIDDTNFRIWYYLNRMSKIYFWTYVKNNGKLISVDTNKNSRKFQDINWQFINTRDDNFGVIEKYIDKELMLFIWIQYTKQTM